MGRLLLVAVLLTACSTAPAPRAATVTPSPVAASPQPSPTPTRSDYLAVVGGPKRSSVSLAASDGTVVATTSVDLGSIQLHAAMSWTSASRTRAYYLNACSDAPYLAPYATTPTSHPPSRAAPPRARTVAATAAASSAAGPLAPAPRTARGTYNGMADRRTPGPRSRPRRGARAPWPPRHRQRRAVARGPDRFDRAFGSSAVV